MILAGNSLKLKREIIVENRNCKIQMKFLTVLATAIESGSAMEKGKNGHRGSLSFVIQGAGATNKWRGKNIFLEENMGAKGK